MISSLPLSRQAHGAIAFAGVTLFGLALQGCASPGFPRPPSLHLAEPIIDLTAKRIGDRVELRWTAPTRTTDGLDLNRPTTVEVCRDPALANPAGGGTIHPPCTPVLRLASVPGASSAIDRLPSSLTGAQTAGQLLAYRVRVLNASGRAAPPVAASLVAQGPAPAPVEAFQAIQTKDGVLLSWRDGPSGDDASVEVLRTDLDPRPAPRKAPGVPATSVPPKPLSPARRADPSAETLLRADPAGAPAHSILPHGMIDQTALADGKYAYRARRAITVHANGKLFSIFSEQTGPVTVAMRDTFPPAVPQGLSSVPGTATSSVTGASGLGPHPTIDLSWQPNTEADLAGYLVYRTEAEGAAQRLTPSPIAASAFRDTAVTPGHRYSYRVTAIDRNGNESAPSAPIEDSPDGR